MPLVPNFLDQTIHALGNVVRGPNGDISFYLLLLFLIGINSRQEIAGLLSESAPVPPDIPPLGQALLFANRADFWACYPLIVAIVPLADILSNLNASAAIDAYFRELLAVDLPRQGIRNAEIEQFKGPLSSLPWRDVSRTRDDQ